MGAALSAAASVASQPGSTTPYGGDYRSGFIESLARSNPQLSRRLTEHTAREMTRRYRSGDDRVATAPVADDDRQSGGSTGKLEARSAAAVVAAPSPLPPPPLLRQRRLSDYEFPFENVVFAGGGGKCRIYYGALKCLSDAGIRPRRFAGASSGSITAALMAVNASPEKLNEYMNWNMNGIVYDSDLGVCSILPNLLRNFGWNHGQRLFEGVGQIMEEMTGNKDITFEQVYRSYDNELCIAAVNINLHCVEYFHVKTTPDMSVRLACRMSMSIPGFFAAVPFLNSSGATDYYVDGGLLCNYPIHAFDGWWLSMHPNDSFYKRLRPLADIPKLMDAENRFGARSDKSLGFLVYSGDEEELLQAELDRRLTDVLVPRPNTKLYRKRRRKLEVMRRPRLAHVALVQATDRFLDALREADIDKDDEDSKISLCEMQKVFDNLKPQSQCKSNEFSQDDAALLFGHSLNVREIFSSLDTDGNGVIDYSEFYAKVDQNVSMVSRQLGYGRREIRSFRDFGNALFDSLHLQSKRAFIKASDVNRTIGLNTDYVTTTDFAISSADHEFLTQQGYRTTEAFLTNYAVANNLPKRKPIVSEISLKSVATCW